MVGRNMSLKNPVTPQGIDPGTVQLVVQRLNHYATPGPQFFANSFHNCKEQINGDTQNWHLKYIMLKINLIFQDKPIYHTLIRAQDATALLYVSCNWEVPA